MRDDVFLPDAADLELHHLYLGMDFLEQHKAEVEEAVYELRCIAAAVLRVTSPAQGNASPRFKVGPGRATKQPR